MVGLKTSLKRKANVVYVTLSDLWVPQVLLWMTKVGLILFDKIQFRLKICMLFSPCAANIFESCHNWFMKADNLTPIYMQRTVTLNILFFQRQTYILELQAD